MIYYPLNLLRTVCRAVTRVYGAWVKMMHKKRWAALVLAAASFLRLMQDRAAESMGLFAATGVVLIAAVVVYLIYRTRNKRE